MQGCIVKEICRMYEVEGISQKKIAKILKIGEERVSKTLKANQIEIKNNAYYRTKYIFDIDFFTDINNEINAYWLGFIYADGFVSEKNKVGISLSIKDIQHLYKFKNDIKSTHPIKEYVVTNGYKIGAEYCRIMLVNKYFYNKCLEKGVLPHKTDKLVFPNKAMFLNEDLIRHFIRGYVDGDGCITKILSKSKKKFDYRVKIVGTKEFLNGIQEYIPFEKVFNLTKRHKDNKNNFNLEIGGNLQVKTMLNYLYSDCNVYLDRKYAIYKEFLQQ